MGLHFVEDEAADRVMQEAEAVVSLEQLGFRDVKIVYRHYWMPCWSRESLGRLTPSQETGSTPRNASASAGVGVSLCACAAG